jgi:hypothetical protein
MSSRTPIFLGGHHGREIGYTCGMASRIGVLGLEGVHEDLQRGDRHTLQLGDAAGALLPEELAQLVRLAGRFTAFQRTPDGTVEILEVDRLGEILYRTALHAQAGCGSIIDRRQHQDGDAGSGFDHLGYEVDAADSREADIEQCSIDGFARENLQSLLAGLCGENPIALLREKPVEGAPNRLFVVDDQQAQCPVCIGHGISL